MQPKQISYMKKIFLPIVALLIATILFVGCNKGGSPKGVATTWLTAFYHMEYETAKKVSTEETKSLLTQLAQFSGMVPDSTKQQYKKITVTVKEATENGDKADVTYMLNDPTSKDQSNAPQVLHLVKQNGIWLVQFSKNDSMGGAEDKGGNDKPAGGDAAPTQAAPPTDAPAGDNPPTDKK